MCVILHATRCVQPADLRAAFDANPDGIGIVYRDRGKVRALRTFDPDEAIDLCTWLDSGYVAHFRWATHGAVDIENCHPFKIGDGAYLAHNGILNVDTPDPSKSDTWHFAQTLRREKIGNEFGSKSVREHFAKLIGPGNKLAVMLRSGQVARVGEWQQHRGSYWSNLHWRDTRDWRRWERWEDARRREVMAWEELEELEAFRCEEENRRKAWERWNREEYPLLAG